MINHSKINFVSYSKKIYPNYKFYSWIDFGFVRDIKSLPNKLNINKIPNKIIYQAFTISTKRINAIHTLIIVEAVIDGSAFIVSNDLVEKFENKKINEKYEFIKVNNQTAAIIKK